jgi:uncharacterized protein
VSNGSGDVGGEDLPFWKVKTLAEMNRTEWESLCDRCGRCCLHKLEDDESGDIYWTNIACRLLDHVSCGCKSYDNRHEFVPDCVELDVDEVTSQTYTWLPPTCAYRLLAGGRDLYWWHPLISGDPDTIHLAGISVRNRVITEVGIPEDAFEDHLEEWPGEIPRGSEVDPRNGNR